MKVCDHSNASWEQLHFSLLTSHLNDRRAQISFIYLLIKWMEYSLFTTCGSREAVLYISPQFSSFLPPLFLLFFKLKFLLAEKEILLLKMRTDVWSQNKWKLTAPTEQYLPICMHRSHPWDAAYKESSVVKYVWEALLSTTHFWKFTLHDNI